MGSRTYVPFLLSLLKILCSYITKHRQRILDFIGHDNEAALDAVMTACEVLTGLIIPLLDEPV